MPDMRLGRDDQSIRSTGSHHSLSTAGRSIPRRRTVTQLTRWVSKRMSRSSMPALGQSIAIELTETNIKALDATVETNTESSSTPPFSHLQYRHHHHHLQHYSPTHEDPPLHSHRAASPLQTEEPSYQPIEGVVQRRQSKRAVRDREREKRVRRSYAEFCEDFTLSGPAGPRKEYDLTMDMNMDQDLNQDQDDNHNHNHNDDFKIQPPKQLSSPPPTPSTPNPSNELDYTTPTSRSSPIPPHPQYSSSNSIIPAKVPTATPDRTPSTPPCGLNRTIHKVFDRNPPPPRRGSSSPVADHYSNRV
ncbi:hypothetical protein POX_a00975 [Penicillium oxalicum]|uniref:hypothetical protein n=1 Tax=Penicillium oxalicum TaxID=69781 RepID=UPI0020B6A282|nr:hypothetical protein POX_a00975 [Penicillium oxalicum]KAI2794376.1 hypothetical protein POX_a00975 [Penicillium oxalicum]